MLKIKIIGGKPLNGAVRISGAKNSVLPIMAAALLTDQTLTILNSPYLHDTVTMSSLLLSLGAKLDTTNNSKNNGHIVSIDPSSVNNTTAHIDIVSKMRASFLVLGPLLARFQHAQVALPGGCSIGKRLIDFHLDAFKKMGAKIVVKDEYVTAYVQGRLKGCFIDLKTSSVGATENILMAAALAEGKTIINNAAIEPEVEDLTRCLLKMGADIKRVGSKQLIIHGVDKLYGCEYEIIPDRIEAATYAIASAITGGNIVIHDFDLSHLRCFVSVLKSVGIKVDSIADNAVRVIRESRDINPAHVITNTHPAIATDLQSLFTSLLSIANGQSSIQETIFNNRFGHVAALNEMKANITVSGDTAHIVGVNRLSGTTVKAMDLRAGAALVLAALSADGETIIEDAYHIDRGYEGIEKKLASCGADICRIC